MRQPCRNSASVERLTFAPRGGVAPGLDALGVADPEIQISGKDEIVVALPNVSNSERAQAQVGQTAQLYFYDWEPNVIGPDGKPAPTESIFTSGIESMNWAMFGVGSTS